MRKWIRRAAWTLAAALFVGASCAAQIEAEAQLAPVEIRLDASGSSATGAGVQIEGSLVAVRAAGTYRVTGTLPEGQLLVKADKHSAVTLILDGADIANATEPALKIESAGTAVIELAEGSTNRLRSGAPVEITADAADAEAEGGALHAKDDLTITGNGALAVCGYVNNGIHCSNRLRIEGGDIEVEAVNNGVKGKDGVTVSGGNLRIHSGGDGIEADSEDGAGFGEIELSGGCVRVESCGDGAQAQTELRVSGGEISLVTGGGSAAAEPKQGDWFGGRGWDRDEAEEDEPSCKGLKAGERLEIRGGEIDIDAADDALHSDGELLLSGGNLTLRSGDDGAHADDSLTLSGGKLAIETSYEGLEARRILVSGGEVDLTATDDGVNANGGSNSFGGFGMGGRMGGGFGGKGRFGGGDFADGERGPMPRGEMPKMGEMPGFDGAAPADGGQDFPSRGNLPPMNEMPGSGEAASEDVEELPLLRITGGKLHVNAEGDGLDSNGDLRVEGGEVIVDGPSRSGNGALDAGAESGGDCRVSGGFVLAIGAAGMAESFDRGSEQAAIACNFGGVVPAGSEVRVADARGKVLVAHVAAKGFASVVFSCSELRAGESYVVMAGEESRTVLAE